MYSASPGVSRGEMGTNMAPNRAMAWETVNHSARFRMPIPTVSPGPTPTSARRVASPLADASSSPKVTTRGPSKMATRSASRAAVAATPRRWEPTWPLNEQPIAAPSNLSIHGVHRPDYPPSTYPTVSPTG